MALKLNVHPTHRPAPQSASHTGTGGRTRFSFLIKHSEIVVHPCAGIRCNTESLCPLTSCSLLTARIGTRAQYRHGQSALRPSCHFFPPRPLSPWPPLICSLQGAHTRHIAGSLWEALSLGPIPCRDVRLLCQHSLLLIVRGCRLSSLCDQTIH